jgi:hypothetical protein
MRAYLDKIKNDKQNKTKNCNFFRTVFLIVLTLLSFLSAPKASGVNFLRTKIKNKY